MSGTEALFAINMITGCAELLKITTAVAKKAKAFNHNRYEVPRQFRNLEAVLGLLRLILQRVGSAEHQSKLNTSQRKPLMQILIHCKGAMDELWALFKKHHLPDNCKTTSIANLKRAVRSVASESRLVAVQNEIQRYIDAITSYTSAFQPTAREISEVVTADLGALIESRILEFAQNLSTKPARGSVSNNSHKDIDQSQNPTFHGQNVHVHQNIFHLSNSSLDPLAIQGIIHPKGASPRPSLETMRTAPAKVNQFTPEDLDPGAGGEVRLSAPSLRSRYSHAGPEPDPNYLHLHRNESYGSTSSRPASVRSSTKATSIFDMDDDASPFPTPLSDTHEQMRPPVLQMHTTDPNLSLLADVNIFIAEGDSCVPNPGSPDIDTANKDAQRAYYQAIEKLGKVEEGRTEIAFRKHRGLTHARLGLTRVTKGDERATHLKTARRHSEDAKSAAARCAASPLTDEKSVTILQEKAKLDEASIRAREARITEKAANHSATTAMRRDSAPGALTAASIRIEAFRIYEGVAAHYEGNSSLAAEYDVHAQALLGCGQVAQTIKGAQGMQGLLHHGWEEPRHYFDRAHRSVMEGDRIRDTPIEVLADLRSTSSRIAKCYGRSG